MTQQNQLILQGFEWNLINDGKHWVRLKTLAKELKDMGITSIWIPPAYKGAKGFSLWRKEDGEYVDASHDVGYGAYDLWDLGEFDQNGSVRTKYGTKEELIEAIQELKKHGIEVIADIVMNHKIGNEEDWEFVEAVEVDSYNRNLVTSAPYTIKATTVFNFPNRNDKYSDFKWNWTHFTGTDHDVTYPNQYKLRRFKDKNWNWEVDSQFGNFDYLLGADIDHSNPAVIEELTKWGKWFTDTLGLDGYRLDVVKHIRFEFMKNWLEEMRKHTGKNMFAVGEYPTSSIDDLLNYLYKTDYACKLFDFPLQRLFHEFSHHPRRDLRELQHAGFTNLYEEHSVTFVDNHDTQPAQAFDCYVERWFKPHAYAYILLREKGLPSVFWGDLFGVGACSRNQTPPLAPMKRELTTLMHARKKYAYGVQHDYFNNPNLVGWTREGLRDVVGSGLAVVMSNDQSGLIKMYVGIHHAGKTWINLMSNENEEVVIDKHGFGYFCVFGRTVAVYVPKTKEIMKEIQDWPSFSSVNNQLTIFVSQDKFGEDRVPHIHFRAYGKDWSWEPYRMRRSIKYSDYFEITLYVGDATGVECCFTDGKGNWDNNNQRNYQLLVGDHTLNKKHQKGKPIK